MSRLGKLAGPASPPALTTLGVLCLGALMSPGIADAEVELTLEGAVGYTDNMFRTPDGVEEHPASVGLSGTWTRTEGRVVADVEGRVDGVTYLQDTFGDEVLGRLDGQVTWWAVPERFAWVLEDVYGQVTTDPFSPPSPENRQDTNYLSTGPDWYIPFGERMRAYLGGRYGLAQYEYTHDDSDRLLGVAGIDRALSPSSRIGVQGRTETVDYDAEALADFDRHATYLTYEFARDTTLSAETSGLTLHAGYTWLEGGTGDRSAPLFELEYSRPLTSSIQFGLELAIGFSDAALDFAGGGPPGSDAGTDPGVIPQAGVYEERSARAVLDFRRPRTNLSFTVGLADQKYETTTLDRERYDASLSAERRMTSRLTGLAEIRWVRDEYLSEGLDRDDTDTEYRLELQRALGGRSSVRLIGLYASRSSDDPLNEFDEMRGWLAFDYSLR